MATFTRETVKLSNIFLDVENPRFASYFERVGQDMSSATQKDVDEYLKKYESIDVLSVRIAEVNGLHPTELIACMKNDDGKFIVLEGNRRVCACKDLCVKFTGNSDYAEFISNIGELEVVVYESREAAQPYISDKHIDGVKKWESIEKSCYYYRMFQERIQLKNGLSAEQIAGEIAKQTVSKKSDVRDCIKKYGFYMSVYETLPPLARSRAWF
ncbi:hypothetical protein FACS1894188_06000 [Clostridia bacterium]|nr:hypothetical protein FACS1894188_06000 [Clostridia bacterium]